MKKPGSFIYVLVIMKYFRRKKECAKIGTALK